MALPCPCIQVLVTEITSHYCFFFETWDTSIIYSTNEQLCYYILHSVSTWKLLLVMDHTPLGSEVVPRKHHRRQKRHERSCMLSRLERWNSTSINYQVISNQDDASSMYYLWQLLVVGTMGERSGRREPPATVSPGRSPHRRTQRPRTRAGRRRRGAPPGRTREDHLLSLSVRLPHGEEENHRPTRSPTWRRD